MSDDKRIALVPTIIPSVTKKTQGEITWCPNCGYVDTDQKPVLSDNPYKRWTGRIVIFELSTGSKVQGKILGMSNEWIDTDNGAVRIADIVYAKWVSEEEARIIRGGPLNNGRW